MNFPLILNLLGSVLVLLSFFMLLPMGISLFSGQSDLGALTASSLLTLLVGGALYFLTRKSSDRDFRHRDVFGVVTLTWLAVSLFGSLPYMFSGVLVDFTDAYFEAMAGFTTTGATVIADIEALPMGVLFWRSFTQWIGGMGIILFALAVLPFLGTGGLQLFKAEVPEITVDRLKPRIIDTAKSLWLIYVFLTALAFVLYMLGGMSKFDALAHAFTTLATGGFSTKNASIGHFNSAYIENVATVFMFLAGVNYTLYFFALRGRLDRFWRSGEFRFYLGITVVATLLVGYFLYGTAYDSAVESLRYSAFQVVSIMTTTGFVTADYGAWAPFAKLMLVMLMFFGGMIGSTSGGMKQIRVLLMFKQGYRELYQLIHPHAVTTVKMDGKVLSKEILGSIWGFLFLYLMIVALATLAMAALGVDMLTATSTVISAVSNVGPAMGDAGPTSNYSGMPTLGKWILAFGMLVGRLEIYTVIVLFVPRFWKK